MGRRPERTVFVHEFVTGGGLAGADPPTSWAAEGGAMRRALAEDFASLPGVAVVMTLDDRLPDEPGPWAVFRVGRGEEPSAFARLVAESDFTLCIAPETGGILEERARWIEDAAGRSLGCSPSVIAMCGDKLRLGTHLKGLGLPSPEGLKVVPAEGLPRDFTYPAVLKPIDGAGGLDTYYVETPDALPESARLLPEAMIQPFVAGLSLSAAYLVVPGSEPVGIGVAEQRMERVGNRLIYRGGVVPARVEIRDEGPIREAIRLVQELAGWVGVDFVYDPVMGAVAILEINPRPTTSYVGFRALLDDPAGIAAAWLAGPGGAGGAVRPPPGRWWAEPTLRGVVFETDGRVARIES